MLTECNTESFDFGTVLRLKSRRSSDIGAVVRQRVTVQYVTVGDGGQAIVGNVNNGSGGGG